MVDNKRKIEIIIMMEQDTTNTSESDEKQHESVGNHLRIRREELGLSTENIANKLNLDPKLIELLEEDNYERFQVETYLKGYLRAYAKILDLDGDKIIALYKTNNPEKTIKISPYLIETK